MDLFSAALKEEMEKKRKNLETVQSINGKSEGPVHKKYISRADMEKFRNQQYQEEQEKHRKEKEEKQRQKQLETKLELPKSEEKSALSEFQDVAVDDDTFNISQEEVIRRLRAKGQPIRLFAETDKQRKIRLRALELMEEKGTEGQQNDFMRTLEQMETGLNMDVLKKKAGVADDMKSKKKPEDNSEIEVTVTMDLLQKDQNKLYLLIYSYLKRVLREWEKAMDERLDEVKRSAQGKRAAATQKQTADYIKPLFRQLKNKELEPDILARITEITHYMQKREYMNAQDAYLKLSIGNSPWPIGVTMVGIHERSAREKIFAAQVAHVLNDETSRKWIQSIARLMRFAQDKWKPDTLTQRIG